MKKSLTGFYILIFLNILFLSSCHAVFRGNVTGKLYDADNYYSDETLSGVGDAVVYLYFEQDYRDEDLQFWTSDGTMPEFALNKKGDAYEPRYFMETVTSDDGRGNFSFSGVMWETYLPQFGRTGDRVELFFLFYHKDYGLVKNTKRIYIISDTTNDLAPVLIERSLNEAVVRGRVVDYDREADSGTPMPLDNVRVSIYLPVSWSVSGETITVADADWPESATYSLLTDENGYFEQKVYFRKFNSEGSVDRTRVRLSFNKSDYSQFCLTTDMEAAFSGKDSDGSAYAGSTEFDASLPAGWHLFDGSSGEVKYWDAVESSEVIETVGLSSGFMKKDKDIDGNGIEDIYCELDVEASDSSTSVAELPGDVHMRLHSHSCRVSGICYDISGAASQDDFTATNGVAIRFYWNSDDQTNDESFFTTTTFSYDYNISGSEPDVQKGYYVNPSVSWTDYNYNTEFARRNILITGSNDVLGKNSDNVDGDIDSVTMATDPDYDENTLLISSQEISKDVLIVD